MALRRTAKRGDGWIGAGNTPEEVPVLMDKLAALRKEYGREHLPFESLVGVYALPDRALFERMRDTGMTGGLNMPFAFALGERSSLSEKKKMMERFAEEVIRHF